MRNILLFLAAALCAQVVPAQSVADKLDEYMTACLRTGKFNGVAFVAKDGEVLLNKGYGWRDARKRIPHDEHSIFQIGSITKQFTATVILHLQEKGRLNVTDRISKYIPGFPNGDKITIEHLLTHTSGIFNYTNDARFMNVQATKPIMLDSLLNVFRNKPLDFEPGSRHSYSNSGYILLGYIIQKVSGKPYEQMVHEVIFRKTGMQHSGFDFKGLKDPNRSTGYFVLSTDTVPSSLVDSSVSYAAGAIYSTTGDLYKWNRALRTDKVISQSSIEKAYTPYKNKYGYGWSIDTVQGKRIIKHNGGIFGFTSDMASVPADDLVVILLCNTSSPLESMTYDLGRIVYGVEYEIPRERKTIQLPESTLQQYTGVYELIPTFKITVTLENGKLKGQATGQPAFEMFAERENFFFLKVVDAQVEFIKGADGKVEKLILHQGGIKQEGRKQ